MQLDVFQTAAKENRPVYINFPFEDVAFRWQSDGSVYRKFYGQQESKIPSDSELFREAISGGVEISGRIRPIVRIVSVASRSNTPLPLPVRISSGNLTDAQRLIFGPAVRTRSNSEIAMNVPMGKSQFEAGPASTTPNSALSNHLLALRTRLRAVGIEASSQLLWCDINLEGCPTAKALIGDHRRECSKQCSCRSLRPPPRVDPNLATMRR